MSLGASDTGGETGQTRDRDRAVHDEGANRTTSWSSRTNLGVHEPSSRAISNEAARSTATKISTSSGGRPLPNSTTNQCCTKFTMARSQVLRTLAALLIF